MKIIIKKIYFLLLLSLVSCGYEPIYSKKGQINFAIESFQTVGDKRINRKIVTAFNLKTQNEIDGYELLINSKKTIVTVSKDATGRTSAYNTIVTVTATLMEDSKVYKEQIFSSNFTYNNTKNKFELSQYQKDIESNLIDIIIEEISIFLVKK
mgnify:CR=1 FL=1